VSREAGALLHHCSTYRSLFPLSEPLHGANLLSGYLPIGQMLEAKQDAGIKKWDLTHDHHWDKTASAFLNSGKITPELA